MKKLMFSPKEQKVVELLLGNYSYKQIAKAIEVGLDTIKVYKRAINKKLGFSLLLAVREEDKEKIDQAKKALSIVVNQREFYSAPPRLGFPDYYSQHNRQFDLDW